MTTAHCNKSLNLSDFEVQSFSTKSCFILYRASQYWSNPAMHHPHHHLTLLSLWQLSSESDSALPINFMAHALNAVALWQESVLVFLPVNKMPINQPTTWCNPMSWIHYGKCCFRTRVTDWQHGSMSSYSCCYQSTFNKHNSFKYNTANLYWSKCYNDLLVIW